METMAMPIQKNFKRRVRARMQKTGESYTAAPARLLEKRPARTPNAKSASETDLAALSGTADAVGGGGKTHITVRVVGNYLNLMQMDPYGALYVTTVFNTESRPGKLQAVHTRHEYTPVSVPGFTSRPEQYYGDCDVIGR